MDQQLADALGSTLAKETWTAEDYRQMLKQLYGTRDAARKFRTVLASLEAENPEPRGAAALKVGIARFMCCRVATALEALSAATDNKDRHYFQAQCHKALHQYGKAIEEMERARDRGWDQADAAMELAELQALNGNVEQAARAVDKLQSKAGKTAAWHYVSGLVAELSGNGEAACDAYEAARKIEPGHTAATFRLAYFLDLHGEEERALELYQECIARPPVHVSALMNMAVLYEDDGKYEQAANCLQSVLAINPNHERAKLFYKDVSASMTMFYDEDQAKRIARRNAVLDIPVTDFELSVRARNCLKKMNIRTLGDLVATSEAELLGYKNFGETSLKEIKDMLAARNLRLGQATEEPDLLLAVPESMLPPSRNEGVLATPIEHVELSVRARRALESLGLKTLGDLVSKSEAELLACKNFGQTSLNEVRQRLTEYGLNFRDPS